MKYKIIILLYILYSQFSATASQWFCKEGTSNKINNTYEVCGIGQDSSENESRKIALKNAFEEFDLVCNKSDDCKNKYKKTSPLRTDCELIDNKYKCYRSFRITVNPSKKSTISENELYTAQFNHNDKMRNFKDSSFYLAKNKLETDELSEAEKISNEIRNNIKSRNQIVEFYLKRGMNLKEVFKIVNANSNVRKFVSLEGEDYFIYGTYKILFNKLDDIDNSPILEAVCDMNIPDRCINIEP